MPRVKPGHRIRSKKPKTSTGCITCKIRRIKCDERKPACLRCTSTGRKCDGYGVVATPGIAEPVSGIFRSEDEHRSFQVLVEKRVTGFFDCKFWNCVLLQAAQHDTAIRHACIAFGRLYERFEHVTSNVTLDDFAARYYNDAISQHLRDLNESVNSAENIQRYLASCMVFLAIELILSHYESALSLIKNATELFQQQSSLNKSTAGWPMKTFEHMLRRLQLQAAGLLTAEYAALGMPPLLPIVGEHRIPVRFSNLTEAKECLEIHGYASHLSRRNTQGPFVSGPSQFLDEPNWLEKWMSAFDGTLQYLATAMTERDRRAANSLRMRSLTYQIVMGIRRDHATTSPDEMSWDKYRSLWAAIIILGERVCHHSSTISHATEPISQHFTVEFSVVGPLYDTARVCRDPMLRRAAIQLLKVCRCQEGLWKSDLAARAAEVQMQLEESCVPYEVREAADVPASVRIVDVIPSFHSNERRASVVYVRQKAAGNAEALQFRETIEW